MSQIEGDIGARRELAQKVKLAAENTGFFYIRNHGISDELIQDALSQAKTFFNQSIELKEKVDRRNYKAFQGYHGVSTTQINDSETKGKMTNCSRITTTNMFCIRQQGNIFNSIR